MPAWLVAGIAAAAIMTERSRQDLFFIIHSRLDWLPGAYRARPGPGGRPDRAQENQGVAPAPGPAVAFCGGRFTAAFELGPGVADRYLMSDSGVQGKVERGFESYLRKGVGKVPFAESALALYFYM